MIYRDNSPYNPRITTRVGCHKFIKSGMKDLSLLTWPFCKKNGKGMINPKWKRARYEPHYVVDVKKGQNPPSGFVKL